ncbi:hypothetical protein HPP92_021927 [Vanilla planifolia]|uniref:Rho-GAP domain-containing protein n=1 Tax=Vanilla planifolia TaxID=51239 RepID=A0A835UDC6_VANPL|nr:hypothetical protein HPP92_022243 [Vanilla planifolia]KAG0458799.1 hypothetical protein HPP92_021927 [Vanilla planifolia]
MQCSHDRRGNSIPTILLSMQRHLYAHGGLQAEGIFRINAENGQELLVREQLNKGIVPHGVDLHCLAGLIKAWFRELPNGVLDSIAPEQVMHCNTEEECSQLASVLPPTEAALLNWAVNLMADVVEYEHINKMNARNIAMVFAPNMTQMANPLTALIHAVQVMNFLKTLILTTLRERLSAAAEARQLHSYCGSHRDGDSPDGFEHAGHSFLDVDKENSTIGASYVTSSGNLFSTLDSDSDAEESFQSFEKRTETDDTEFISERWSPTLSNGPKRGDDHRDVEGLLDRLNIKKRVKKLSTHPLFQLTRPTKEGEVDVVVFNEGTEAWA